MAAQRPSLRLPQSMRLKQRRDFTELKQKGQRLAAGCLIANWTTSPAGSGSRLGVITSRQLGSAVTRSRARALLREPFRLHPHELRQPVWLVLLAPSATLGNQRDAGERASL